MAGKTAAKTKAPAKGKSTSSKAVKTKLKYSKDQYIQWYKSMLLIRKFEETASKLYIQQKFGGFCHLYIGQEAVVCGTVSACEKEDKHMTAYRSHGHPIAMGTDPKKLMAELYGKATGCSKGKGGSMHFFDKEVNFLGGHGIVGAQIPMGAGVAFADKYNGSKAVSFVSFGDGASRQGALHETFNMAMTWKIPAIFIVENNNYAMGTSVERTSNVTDLSKLADSYEMPSMVVDGMTVEAVHEAIEEACKRVRKGEGPMLLDIRTYRYKGHSMSDPQKYRSKEEVKKYQSEDPLEKVLNTIKSNKILTEKQLLAIQEEVKTKIAEAVKFAEDSADPTPDELYKDVYDQDDYPYIKEFID
jgi:pyruvate dehydrogenase E1 component alpha subunit